MRLKTFLFAALAILLTLCLLTAGLAAQWVLHQSQQRLAREQLASICHLFIERAEAEAAAARSSSASFTAQTSALFANYPQLDGIRLTLIAPDGLVLGDSTEIPGRMSNHAQRPEVAKALAGGEGWNERYSDTLGERLLYVALPLHDAQGKLAGVVRASRSARAIHGERSRLMGYFWVSWVVGLAAAALAAHLLASLLLRPTRTMAHAVARYAEGDFHERVLIDTPEEASRLGLQLNRMAQALEGRLREIMRQRNEREAILASMREGVLAIDDEERLLMINRAGEALLGIKAQASIGRLVQEVLRHAELQKLIARALKGAGSQSTATVESQLQWDNARILHATAVPLHDEVGARTGILLVINDVTRLMQLENMRRDFVANVSHELRTPITSIKGFIETLQAGALDDREDAEHFLEIIARQAARLESIIEDLLALSRIEREADSEAMPLQPVAVQHLLENVAANYAHPAAEKEIALHLTCAPELRVRGRGRLLEQAIGNLVDNAIKYSPRGGQVEIEATAQEGTRVALRVADHGSGIGAAHLPRLFERFYRVDPARSRELGGTGLGLAIVKHIVQAHGGQVTVASEPGQGSTFTITLPAAAGPENEAAET